MVEIRDVPSVDPRKTELDSDRTEVKVIGIDDQNI